MTPSAARFLHADHLGSIVLATDAATGLATTTRFKYDEYGMPQVTGGSGATLTTAVANGGRFMYTGQIWVPELGMYYFKARMYSASMRRFMQTDPIGYADQVNLYGYAWNDPVNLVDYLGLEAGCIYGPNECGLKITSPEEKQFGANLVKGLFNTALFGVSLFTGPEVLGIRGIGTAAAERAAAAAAERIAIKAEIRSLEKGAVTLEKRAAEHEAKAAEFAKNPTVRPGMEGRTSQEIANQQAARISHIKSEAAEFRQQAAERLKKAEEFKKKLDDY